MRSSFLWRNRVLLISGSLLLFALHLLSSGVQPGARASRPAIVLSQLMRPFQAFDSGLSGEANGFFHDYLELVGTRQENDQLKRQLAQLEGQRARMTELENENRRLSDLLELA